MPNMETERRGHKVAALSQPRSSSERRSLLAEREGERSIFEVDPLCISSLFWFGV